MIKSPLRYPGGKSRAVRYLAGFLPEYREFREVFFGGGSLSFFLSQQNPEVRYIGSDLNFELFCFWQQLKTNPVALIHDIQEIFDTYRGQRNDSGAGKELFALLVNRRTAALTELQRACDFFVLNRITFSGVVDSGGFSNGSFLGRFTQSSIDRLKPIAALIRNFQFLCEDYQVLLKKPGNDVCIFLDPPYYAATSSKLYGKGGLLHTCFDHERLKKDLAVCPHNWLMTYDNSEFIKELYKDFYCVEWRLQYGMTRNSKETRNELLIANYDIRKCSLGQ